MRFDSYVSYGEIRKTPKELPPERSSSFCFVISLLADHAVILT